MMDNEIVKQARQALIWQLQSIEGIASRLDSRFADAVSSVAAAGKVLTSGIGKSGYIARKLAATLSSVRITGIFLHPVEAMHGDSGIMRQEDCLVVFSKSGETAEIVRLCKLAVELGVTIIAITSREHSAVAAIATHVLVAPCEHEMDPDDILPTTSTTSALVVADLLAVAAAMHSGDVAAQLQQSHPRGMIGAAMMRCVEDVMHTGDSMPSVSPDVMLVDALAELSVKGLGIVCVLEAGGTLRGILTDGDVRRIVVQRAGELSTLRVSDVMIEHPITIEPSDLLHAALQKMERRERQISALPVTVDGRCVGVLRLHDIVRLQL